MKKTLLKKTSIISQPRFYLGSIALLLFSGLSSAHNLTTVLDNKTYAIVKDANTSPIIVKGKVTDRSDGQSMPGVSVKIKGTSIGTVTDVNGNFSLQAEENAILIFTYIGYDAVEAAIDGKTTLSISLQPTNKNLNEVIVVGYGTQKKTSSTAAVSTINTAEIARKPVANLTNSLVGRASGLIATQGSGEPGIDGSGIQIRGTSTNGRQGVLLIVDGVPRDFSRLDPNTIATFSVLKDAAAVAPYGVAGANGVLLVTTKPGQVGKATLSYSGYYGWQNPTSVPRFVNSFEYASLRNEADANEGRTPTYNAGDLQKFKDHSDPDGHSDGHPLDDIILKNQPIQYHNLTLSGGNDDIRYFASVGYNHQAGMWSTTYLNRYNGSLNLTAKATKTTTVNFSVNSYLENQHFPSQGAGTIIGQAQRQNPTYPVRYNNGLPSGYIGQSLIGEIYGSGYHVNENTSLLTQLSIEQQLPIKGLSLKGVISYDNGPDPVFGGNTSFTRRYTTPIEFYTVDTLKKPYVYNKSIQGSSKPQFYEAYTQNHALTYQGLLNYSGSFGKSDITGLLVAEYRNVRTNNFSANRINYNLDIDELDFGGPLPSDATVGGSSGGQKQIGYVYRVGYAYDKKYLFEATGRYDGSYLFGPGRRFGFFPAFSAGWRLSEEKFIKDNFTWIDNLKIRASWGQSGNYPNGSYLYLSQYNVASTSAVIGGNATQGIYENLQKNADFSWEKANKTDIGFEGSFFKGALGLEVDYFYEKRSNLLVTIGAVLPGEYGVATGPVNAGIIDNRGVDLTITSFKNFSNGLRLDIKGTLTYAKNKQLKVFENGATFNNPNRRQTGRSLGEQYGLNALGYFSDADFVDPKATNPVLKPGIPVPTFGPVHPGDLRYADLSGPNGTPDGRIDGDDNTDIGHPQTPQLIWGLEPRIAFKNFDLDLLFQGSGLSNIRLENYYVFPFLGSGSATELYYQDHWTPSTPNATYPRVTNTPSNNNTQVSSWYLRNNSYIRLKSAELGYTFPNKLTGNTIRSLRIYAAGQNIFFWTPSMKESIDPENSGSNQNYYQQRVLSVGLNATF
ncbi:TonB-linked SusC/RagA family outer membrane protein [Mucilaginibacter sp. UYP25]|uniref:SusC/RagA family TonB-linked outer membrane protein n=1 Tax=unclassified Mucilaginibacter TaxID=2617802 RepID=UPI003391253D